MQTFLPSPNFYSSAKILDKRRIAKQRVEADQILTILLGRNKSNAWVNHPAVKMWRGCTNALIFYRNIMIYEWKNRKNKDGSNCKNNMPIIRIEGKIIFPKWLGNERFHSKHRSSLLAKDYEYYSQFGWSEKPKIGYYWPI